MKVKCLKDIDINFWNKIAFQESNIFHSYEWSEVTKKEGNTPLFFIAQENDEISGILLVLQNRPKRKIPGAIIGLFTTFTIPSEPVLINNEKETFQSLIQAVDLEARKRKVIYTQWQVLYTRYRNKDSFIDNGYEVLEFGTHLLNLKKDLDKLWSGIHSKHRNSIRRAQKTNIEVIELEDLKAYHRLSYMTYQRTGRMGPSYEHLNNIMSGMKSKGMCKLFCAVRDNQILAAAFLLLCNKKMYYLQGASAENTLGAANLLHWRIIEWGHKHDFQWYDFGGASLNPAPNSKGRNINRFKERFGGELIKIYGGFKLYSPLRYNILKFYSIVRKSPSALLSELRKVTRERV